MALMRSAGVVCPGMATRRTVFPTQTWTNGSRWVYRFFGGHPDRPPVIPPVGAFAVDPLPNKRHVRNPPGESSIYPKGTHPNTLPDHSDGITVVDHMARSPNDFEEDGTRKWGHAESWRTNHFHPNLQHEPPINTITVDGQTYIRPTETPKLEDLYMIPQKWLPFTPRRRLEMKVNYPLCMKAEFCFFYIPTFIIAAILLPAYVMTYMWDEAIYTTMTVKVIGRQWYWVYEVESPTDDDDDEEEGDDDDGDD